MGVKTKEMKVLSIEQMNQLKERGIDVKPKGACLMYTSDSSDDYYLKYGESTCEDDIKAFSLQDLIELLPYTFNNNYLRIYRSISIYYFIYENMNLEDDILEKGRNPLEAAYNMLLWVIENGYLKTK